jgi:hypothetical protein
MIRFKMGIRWGYENAKTSTKSTGSISVPLKGERFYSVLMLFLFLSITFFPLIGGKNFIPFQKYPTWGRMLAHSSGQEFQVGSSAFKRLKVMPWADQDEPASLAINWPEDLYFARQFKSGRVPLWDPYTGGGVPTIDNGQSRPFNPFRLPFYLFPTTWVYSLTWLGGLVFGGIGAYLWLSRRGLSTPAVTLGSGLFALNPWVLDRLVLTDSAAYFVLPWCLLTLEQTTWRNWPSIARAVLSFVLMGHCGHPEMAVIMAAVAATIYLFNAHKDFAARIKTIGVVATLTFACLTVLWLPFLRLFVIGDIYKKRALLVYEYSWRSLATLPSDMFIAPTVCGVLVAISLAWKRIPKVWVAFCSAAILVLFPLPWIGDLPPKLLNYLKLPAFYLKGLFWASLSFLLPYGLDAYRASKKDTAIVAILMGAAMLAVSISQFVVLPMARNDISAFPITTFILFALGLLSLLFFRTAQGRFFPLLMSGMILAPLALPLSLNKLLWNTVDFKTNSVVEWLKSDRPNARTVSIGSHLVFAIPPNLGQAYGIRCAEVMAVVFLNNYRSMFRHPRAIQTAVAFDFFSLDAFKHMGANTLLLLNDASPKGLDLLVKGPLFSAYSIPGAHGRLYFAERASHYKPGTDFPTQVLSLSQDTDAVAVVEGMGNPVPEVIPEIPSGRGKAVFERDDVEKVIVRTECSSEGLLVLRDSWYPSWLAFIDEKRAPILRINGCFRGVIVPAGEHMVRFVYHPILVYVAGGVSFAATLLITVVCVQKHLIRAERRFMRE